MTTRDINKLLNDCDELILKWLNSVKGVVDSEGLHVNIHRESLLQNKITRVIKQKHVTKYLEILAAIAELKDAYSKFYEQLVKCMKLENSVDGVEIAEVLRFNTSKSGGEEISLKECVDRMKEGQNDICYITGESITVVSSSSFLENLRKNGYEVPYMADPVDEYTVHRLKQSGGTKLKPTMKEGLDSGDHDVEKTLEELNIESKLCDKVDEVIVSNRMVDSLRAHTASEHGWSTNMKHCVQQPSGSQQHNNYHRKQQQQAGHVEEKGKEEKGRKGEGERGQEGRKEEEKEAEEEGGEQIKKDVTDWVGVKRRTRRKNCKMVQIFVKVNGSKATPMEVNLTDDSRRCDETDPEGRGRVCDTEWESAEKRREAEELWSQ